MVRSSAGPLDNVYMSKCSEVLPCDWPIRPSIIWCLLFRVCTGCQAVWLQREAVLIWPHLLAPTPTISESWTWAIIIQEIQEGSWALLDWRIHMDADCSPWGRKKPTATQKFSNFYRWLLTLTDDWLLHSVPPKMTQKIPLYTASSCLCKGRIIFFILNFTLHNQTQSHRTWCLRHNMCWQEKTPALL